jgi:two-component system CheB/CheR fusion protein
MATTKVRSIAKRAATKRSRSNARVKAGKRPRTVVAKKPEPAPRDSSVQPFIVGIGASAGGLQALTSFFEAMPSDSGMVFVVVTHQQPSRTSLLPALLSRSTRMPVEPVHDDIALEPDHVYVSVPGKNVAVLGDTLQLMAFESGPAVHLPIDYFFRSLARDRNERAICIVLSGTGTDGTLGLRAIKGNSGLAIVQDESSAHFSGMPHSAAATLLADHVLNPDQMPVKLLAYARSAHAMSAYESSGDPPLANALAKLFVLLRNRTGHDFSGYKRNTIERRVARRMRIHQLSHATDYLSLVQAQPHELDLLFRELLINVTQFFRDPHSFDALAEVLTKHIERAPDQAAMRVWVPACSTGEEAYSIAMLVTEISERLGKHVQLQVFATDINPQVIELARAGLYPQGIALDVGEDRLKRFFIAERSNYRICKPIRDCIVFSPQDILRDPPFTRLDLLSCRNLLIYMNSDLQHRLLPLFHYALKPGACLWLGTSETASAHADLFTALDHKWKLYERRKTLAGVAPKFDLRVDQKVDPGRAPTKRDSVRAFASLKRTMETVLLDRFAPATIVITDQGDIAYIHGRTGAYLEPAAGEPRHNVFAMAREGLRTSLQAAVRAATAADREVTHHGISVRTNEGVELVTLVVQRITEPEPLRGLIRISFSRLAAFKPTKGAAKKRGDQAQPQSFARELRHTRDTLESALDEVQTSNEELRSANEELQSTNEELQSTNEELETSKEELQSVNEELQTVNAELEMKNDELAQLNDDMQNLLNATDIATLFLDRELRIKRFTDQARGIVRLIATDVGRPIADLVSQIRYDRLTEDASEVLRTLQPHEAEAHGLDGRWLLVRILPYRTAQDRIEGVVITFVDIDRVKRAESLAASREFAESIVQAVPAPLVVLDAEMHIVSANRAFSGLAGADLSEIRGTSLFDIGSGVFAFPKLRTLISGVLNEGHVIEAFEFAHQSRPGDMQRMQLNARRLEQVGVSASHVLLAFRAFDSNDSSH